MKQLFEQNTHSKQKIINDTKKHIALLDNQISNERETMKEKLEQIKELNEKITGLSNSIKQK